jgi:hypothetical protein
MYELNLEPMNTCETCKFWHHGTCLKMTGVDEQEYASGRFNFELAEVNDDNIPEAYVRLQGDDLQGVIAEFVTGKDFGCPLYKAIDKL